MFWRISSEYTCALFSRNLLGHLMLKSDYSRMVGVQDSKNFLALIGGTSVSTHKAIPSSLISVMYLVNSHVCNE